MLPITAFFAGLLTLYYVKLAYDVIRLRKSNRVSLGSGGVTELEKAIRIHGNFAEYVPLGLVLMCLLEANGGTAWLVSALGCALLLGRVCHALGLRDDGLKLRVAGMMLTFAAMVVLAASNIFHAAGWHLQQ